MHAPEGFSCGGAHGGVGIGDERLERLEYPVELLHAQRASESRLLEHRVDELGTPAPRILVLVCRVLHDDLEGLFGGRSLDEMERSVIRSQRDGLDGYVEILEELRQHAGHERRDRRTNLL